jgi:hypothetical protein
LQPSLKELTIINNQGEIETMDYLMGENEGLPLGSLVEFHKLRPHEATVRTLVGRRPRDPGFDSSLPKDLDTGSRVCEHTRFAESLPEELEELVLKACLKDVFVVVKMLFERRRQGAYKSMKVATLAFAYGISLDEATEERSRCVAEGQKLGTVVSK